jgi:release factor glutamine methyltransferase
VSKELHGLLPEPEISAILNIIMKTRFGLSKLHSLALPESSLSRKQVNEILKICRELKAGKPIQYILGETSFYNCTIRLNSNTLIPRPETEELVDLVIKENKGFRGKILDVGTGSGCIAISLAINLPGTIVTGIDISEAAIVIAKENAILNKTSALFSRADIFNIDAHSYVETDIIVSNPPYIRDSEKEMMTKNVLDFEPHSALFVPDSDPLVYYRAILKLAEISLRQRGKVYFEINEALGRSIFEMLKTYGYSGIALIKDINGKERMIKGTKND